MKLNQHVLDEHPTFHRRKNTWGCSWEVNGILTQFTIVHIEQWSEIYLVYVKQGLMKAPNIWENVILLGQVDTIEEVETLYNVISRNQ